MGFAIICDARAGEGLGIDTLALVDRRKTRSLWWTSDDWSIAINYQKRDAAEFAAKRLKKNRARVVPFEQALRTLQAQARAIREAGDDDWDHPFESGFGGHGQS
ncbi:hypothetical protein AO935_15455 [Pseudomonas aeruginosa]|uniref:hypothetical protein n=1 Tax=Pseudomonas aeruginosa TaxID=287 RepID=UPI00071BB449|nr:hypothetical protein [Pseudomonas aeruginosa]KSF20025.1 hypothetical protein AO935_15455 [Pseudomonas aeruginosa]